MKSIQVDKQKVIVHAIRLSAYVLIVLAVLLAKNARSMYDEYIYIQLPETASVSPHNKNDETVVPISQKISFISNRQLLGTTTPIEKVAPVETKKKSELKVRLVGTTLTPGGRQIAILEDSSTKKQDAFTPGESIFSKATLKEVFVDKVSVEREGLIEFIELSDAERAPGDPNQSNIRADGGNFVVPEDEVTAALSNLPVLLSQARAVPYFRNGQSIGMRLYAIKSGSLYEKLGLKNSDIIKQINNSPVNDPSKALKLFEDLKSQRSISVSVERDSQDVNLNYQIR